MSDVPPVPSSDLQRMISEIRCVRDEFESYHCNVFHRGNQQFEIDRVDDIEVGGGTGIEETTGSIHVFPEGAKEPGERPDYIVQDDLECGILWRDDGQYYRRYDHTDVHDDPEKVLYCQSYNAVD